MGVGGGGGGAGAGTGAVVRQDPQWGTADAEIEARSFEENPEFGSFVTDLF